MFLMFLLFSIASYSQSFVAGKFTRDYYNSNNYIIFNLDLTFKYRYQYDLLSDISCGRYETKQDTIYMYYMSSMSDSNCNTEGIVSVMFSDTTTKKLRPNKLYFKGNKLYEIVNGKIFNKTEKHQIDFKPNGQLRSYRRKYLFFGPYQSKSKRTYYMTSTK